MPGFLDPYAVSIKAEYTRYLDADLLGKIVFKNFALNVLKVDEESIRIPLSRQGDLGTYKDSCDAGIRFDNRSYSVETKSSRWIVAKRCKIDPKPRWSFSGLKHSAKGTERGNYDLVFAVGINAPGLEDSLGYWRHLHSLKKTAEEEGRDFDLSVWPHEPEFLNMCGIYILPRQFIFTHCKNTQDITIRTLSERRDFDFLVGVTTFLDFGKSGSVLFELSIRPQMRILKFDSFFGKRLWNQIKAQRTISQVR